MLEALITKDRRLWNDYVQKVINKNGQADFKRFDTSSIDFSLDEVIQACFNLSLFEEKRFVFLRFHDEKDQDKNLTEDLLQALNMTQDMSVYICLSKKPLVKSSAHKLFKNYTVLENQSLTELSIRSKLVEHKIEIDDKAYQNLLGKLQGNRLDLDKFIQQAELLERRITNVDINLMLNDPLEENIFALTNALVNGKLKDAFRIYHDYVYQKTEVMLMIGTIATSLRTGFQVSYLSDRGYKPQDIADELGINTNRVYAILKNQYQNPEKTLATLNKLAHYEQGIKQGTYDKYLAFELFLMSFI